MRRQEFQLGDNKEIAAVPDPDCKVGVYIRQDDEGDDFILGENKKMVDEIVLDPDQEAEDCPTAQS